MQQQFGMAPPIMAVDTCVGEVQLFLECVNLPNLDMFSKSDPRCNIKIKTAGIDHDFKILGKTEQIANNLNPKFKTHIPVKYYFEKEQKLIFSLIDEDNNGDFDVIGTVETTMGSIMGSRA
jgi:hypothetical protein